ncbi:helix-turn-helix transcriptional regulator [Nakamurella lactea]|uniref:helix-turn-helix transcriptional regulator n=1 Tax=Nakamurella lactea TaxID=459515 RepID=UPI000409E0FB|nr:LuxR family transcriptional regulator [Nakamurella lactea]
MNPSTGEFVGRTTELARIDAAGAQVATGRSSLVWIEGAAGAGKSSLLERALDRLPAEFGVIRAEADEFSADLPYSLAGQLAPVNAETTMSAAIQLLAALGDLGAQRPDAPLAVVLEDLHWADPASREALLMMARRLVTDRILLLITSRPQGPPDGWDRIRLDARRTNLIQVGALTPTEVGELAARSGVALTPAAARRLHAHTAGHALYVKTLLTELGPEQLTAPEGDLPAPRSLAATTAARLVAAEPDAVELALALAVLGRPSDLTLVGRVAGLAAPTAALDALLPTGLVTRVTTAASGSQGSTVIAFAHPLLRAAIVDDLSPLRLQQLNLAAAQELGPVAGLPHRVAATDRADDELAEDLTRDAERHRTAGSRGLAARDLLWAARVCASPVASDRHLLDAVRLLVDDSQQLHAAGLRERVVHSTPGPARSLVLGILDWEAGDAAAAVAHLSEAAACTDPEFRGESVEAQVRLARAHAVTDDGPAAVALTRSALEQQDLAPELEQMAWIAGATGVMWQRGGNAALGWLHPRLPQPPEETPASEVDLLILRGTLKYYARRNVAAAADLRAAIQLVRAGARAEELPRAHLQLAQVLALTGDWDEGLIHARLALALVSDRGLVWMRAQANAVLATLMAVRGRWQEAATHLGYATAAATRSRIAEAAFTARNAAANLARAHGDAAGVLAAYAPLLAGGDAAVSSRLPMATTMTWFGQIVSATIDIGDLAAAERRLEIFADAALRRELDLTASVLGLRAQLLAARADAGTDAADEAVNLYRSALDHATEDLPLLDRADLRHRLGRLQLARGNRREGTDELRSALAILDGAGATPYAERVAADLGRAGLRIDVSAGRPFAALTEREQDVVALVAKGLTNREVAAQLYVTDKAVEYHLGNVFGKLGIRSRRELRSLA